MKKILLLALILAILLVGGCTDESYVDRHEQNCKEICSSNNLLYYKYTSSGYAGLIRTCYCKDMEGKISTLQM